ncbi:MAG: hypothetical protein ACR2H0_07390 [Candidatus Limnocylindrales bacterium]
MSRAEPAADTLPPAPRVGAALRSAASDFFYNSWRLVPANALVAGALLAVVVAWLFLGLAMALALAPLVAFPLGGLFRLTGFIARGRDAVLSDVWSTWSSTWREMIGVGVALTLASFVFTTNIVVGLAGDFGPATFVAVMAGWGLVGTWVYALLAWPILMDPDRVATRVRDRLRLAGLLAVAFPLRLLGFTLVIAVFLVLSTAFFAAVLTVSLAFAALVVCRYVLPASDRLSTRAGLAVPSVITD